MAAPAYSTPPPQKTLYRIGEVSKLTNTKAFVLRYWETEFPMLQPVKSPSGHRLYRKEDIETVYEIKRLLYDKGFTIAGARRFLAEARGLGEDPAESSNGNRGSDSRNESRERPDRQGEQLRREAVPPRAETARGYVAPAKNEFEQTRRPETGPGLHTAQGAGQVTTGKSGGAAAGVAPAKDSAPATSSAPAPASNQVIEANRAQRAALEELREKLNAILTLLEGE
jgi:DNA-binding transcriptional MerR regulator